MAVPLIAFPAPRTSRVDLLVVAGEHSGDQHAAAMVREALMKRPELQIAALGGPELAQSGAQLLADLTSTSVVGFVEVLKHLRYYRSVYHATLEWIKLHRPSAVCFIDYPGLNLRLAKALNRKGLSVLGGGFCRTLYYISPQIWAWKSHRRFTMELDLEALAVIFPFEVACYKDTQLPTRFVGHPFVSAAYRAPVLYDPTGPILLLPGSRRQAIGRIFPVLLEAYRQSGESRPAVVLYPTEDLRSYLESFALPPNLKLERTGTAVRAAAVLTSSGTMSMHCALAGIPGAVVYRTSALTYFLGRALVKTPYIGIANLLLGQPMYPEFIQQAAQPKVLALELRSCLYDRERRDKTASYAHRLRESLHEPATGTAADWLLEQLRT